MKFNKLQRLLSVPRLDRYMIAAGGDKKRTVRLYRTNLKVAQAFHPVLGVFEVVLRNEIDQALQFYFNDPDWIITKKQILGGRLTSQVIEVEKRLLAEGIAVTRGKVLAGQMLSFWTDMFGKPTFKRLQGSPIHIFRHPPPALVRKDASIRLNLIRQFRNRINHNEPICFKHNAIDFTQAVLVHQTVYEILDWIDPDVRRFLKGLDTVPNVLKRAANI